MRISVAVITYNWPEALELVLRSLARQTELPHEVIVTDDGSQPDTRELLLRLARDYPVRLVHLWQPDDGARMSRARNRAIAAAQGDYVILLDGDMVVERHFVADHRAFARRGCFAQGSRVLTDARSVQGMLGRDPSFPDFFHRGIDRRRHTLRMPLLAGLFAWPSKRQRGIKSCNMAFWREDLVRLNGFNEAMTGWGREDTELAVRAFHAGLLRRDLRLGGLSVHLYHRTRKHLIDNPNDRILEQARQGGLVRCERGVEQYMVEFASAAVDLRTVPAPAPVRPPVPRNRVAVARKAVPESSKKSVAVATGESLPGDNSHGQPALLAHRSRATSARLVLSEVGDQALAQVALKRFNRPIRTASPSTRKK